MVYQRFFYMLIFFMNSYLPKSVTTSLYKRDSSVGWFFGFNHLIWYSLKESKKIFIHIIIYGDTHTFIAYIHV
jgi:hypothetical protein